MVAWSWHCAYCGRFVGWNADRYMPFGGSTDIDPPDDEYLCKRCVKLLTRRALKEKRLPSNCVPAKWEHWVAAQLGMVRAGPSGAAWGIWCMPDMIPSDYVVHFKPTVKHRKKKPEYFNPRDIAILGGDPSL